MSGNGGKILVRNKGCITILNGCVQIITLNMKDWVNM